MSEFRFEIEDAIGILDKKGTETVELNLISFGNHPAMYDLRRWQTDPATGERRMLKGVRMSEDAVKTLYELLKARFHK